MRAIDSVTGVTTGKHSTWNPGLGLQSTTNDKWVVRSGTGYAATAADLSGAEPFHFQATDLGSYLLWDNDKEFIDSRPFTVVSTAKPSKFTDFTVEMDGSAATFTLPSLDRAVAVNARSVGA